jgi:GH18 family chitinase
VAAVPHQKLVLGMPFYGYDWPTVDDRPRSKATGPPTPVTYDEIVAANHPRYWDEDAAAPWTVYKLKGKWHEIYYDDPSSLTLKARLARAFRLRGTGAWALGMEGGDRAMLQALVGAISRVVTAPIAPPPARPAPAASPRQTARPQPSRPAASPSSSPQPSPLPLPTPPPL